MCVQLALHVRCKGVRAAVIPELQGLQGHAWPDRGND